MVKAGMILIWEVNCVDRMSLKDRYATGRLRLNRSALAVKSGTMDFEERVLNY